MTLRGSPKPFTRYYMFIVFFALAGVEALAGAVYLLAIPPDPKHGLLFGYSAPRLIMAAGLLAAFLLFSFLALMSWRKKDKVLGMFGIIWTDAGFRETLAIASFTLAAAGVSIAFLEPSTWHNIRFYLLRLRPAFVWAALVSFQTLVLLVLTAPTTLIGSGKTLLERFSLARLRNLLERKLPPPGADRQAGRTWCKFALFLMVVALGVGMRLYLAYAYHGNFDQYSYEVVTNYMADGKNIYFTERYNYAPLWAYILFLLRGLSEWARLEFHFVVRSFLTLVDIANGVLVGLIAVQVGRARSVKSGLAVYLVNPVSFLLIGYHGQFENLAMLPLLLAVYLHTRQQQRTSLTVLWLLGTLAMVIKHNSIFGVWMLFVYASKKVRRALLLMTASGLVFLLTFLPYLPEGREAVAGNVFFYQSFQGDYGLGVLIPAGAHKLAFFALLGVLPFMAKNLLKLPVERGMAISFIALVVMTYGFAEQYLIMPVIWGSIFLSNGWHWLFTLFAALFLVNSPNNINLNGEMIYYDRTWLFPAWLAAVGWLLGSVIPWKWSDLAVLKAFYAAPTEKDS